MSQGKAEGNAAVHFPEQADQYLPSEAPSWNTPSNQSPWLWPILEKEWDRWELLRLVQLVPNVTRPASSLLGARDLTVRHTLPLKEFNPAEKTKLEALLYRGPPGVLDLLHHPESLACQTLTINIYGKWHIHWGERWVGTHTMMQICPAGGAGNGDSALSRHGCGTSVGEQRDGWVVGVTERPKIIFNLGNQVPYALG